VIRVRLFLFSRPLASFAANSFVIYLLRIALLSTFLPALACALELSEGDEGVKSARESLAEQWDMPWYSAEADDLRPVTVKVPKPPSNNGFLKWLSDLFSNLFGGNLSFYDIFVFFIWVALAVAVLWLVYQLMQGYLRSEVNQTDEADISAAEAQLERVEALPLAMEVPSGDYLALARRALGAGEYDRAIAYIFAQQLLVLDEHQVLRLVKGKTNRYYIAEVRSYAPDEPRLAELLRQTVEVFERSFFGRQTPCREEVEVCLAGVESSQALLVRRREGRAA
jgi:hypothetical protein